MVYAKDDFIVEGYIQETTVKKLKELFNESKDKIRDLEKQMDILKKVLLNTISFMTEEQKIALETQWDNIHNDHPMYRS